MKKVLIIQYFYKPLNSSSSIRYENILKNLKNKNIEIHILTSSHKGTERAYIENNKYIYRVNSKFLKKNIEKNIEKNEGKTTLKQKIIHFFMWPDFAFLWIFKAYKEGMKIIKKNNIDTIHSVSFPFSCHLVGFFLKSKFPKITWNLDYIDPFSIIKYNENPSNNERLYRQLNYFIEKICLKKANKIFLLKEAIGKYKERFKESSKKMIEVPQLLGIDREKYSCTKPFCYEKGTINLVYAGTLYKSIRNPDKFLKLFEELAKVEPKLRLHFIGDLKDCDTIVFNFKNKLKTKIFYHGKKDSDEVLKYLKGADILINISNDCLYQLPGKVVEYVYFNKKIINFYQNKLDNSNTFFEKYEGILSITSEEEVDKVLKFIKREINIENNLEDHYPEKLFEVYFGG